VVILGTRPEAIKLLPVIRAVREEPRLAVRVVTTGQHREMVDQILEPFGVIPEHDLDIMRPDQSLNDIVCRVLPRLEQLYQELGPSLVLVQGDTTSAFAAGLAAFYRRIPVGHVEAGLRSFNRFHPYPEESNRRMLSCVTDLHFAATPWGAQNLMREGVPRGDILVTGNTVVDCLLGLLARPELLLAHREADPGWLSGGNLVLITLHRRENWMGSPLEPRSPLEQVLEAVARAASEYPQAHFVYPVHRNPRVRGPAERILGGRPNVHLLDPVSYLPFVDLMAHASVILTDSGGIQEEAPSLGVPVLVARETTERPEGLECGTNHLVGTQPEVVLRELRRYLDRSPARPGPRPCPNPFGDGQASVRIRQAILHRFGFGERPEEFRSAEAPPTASTGPLRPNAVP
jgi:UDP-N-acetylglucosamine 2-epimerase (non-hydrolysing)